jgi:hypothetical protein
MNAGGVLCLCGIDARRPASWIALSIGVVVGCGVAAADGSPWGLAATLVVPVMAVVAAVGDLPWDLCQGVARRSPFPLAAIWAAERAAWPLVGGMLAAVVTAWPEPPAAAGMVASMLAGGLALVVVLLARAAAVTVTEAAMLALACGGFGGLAGLAARMAGVGPWGAIAAAVAGWSVGAVVMRSCVRSGTAGPERALLTFDPFGVGGEATGNETIHVGPLPAVGPTQLRLEKLAMVAALAAMAVWLVMRPDILGHPDEHAGDAPSISLWATFSAAWFIALAVPRAALLDGTCGRPDWQRLLRSAALPPRYGQVGPQGMLRPWGGMTLTTRAAVVATLGPAAMLGWPPLVGGLLSLSRPASAWPPLLVATGLAAAALTLAGVVVAGGRRSVDRESIMAVILALATAVAIAAAAVRDRGNSSTADTSQTPQPCWAAGCGHARAMAHPGSDFMLRKMRLPAKVLRCQRRQPARLGPPRSSGGSRNSV